MDAMTIEQFKEALPAQVRKSINPAVAKQIISTLSDPDMYEHYRENLLGYTQVMSDGRFKISGYINAVKYVSHKLMGKTDLGAYTATFPDKIQSFMLRGVESKDIASYVSAFAKSKLVTLIMQQSLTPSWVLNQDLYQKALNVQAELMMTANSEKVRTEAANSLLTHLKMPEKVKVELDIGIKKDSSIDALRQATLELAEAQRRQISAGASSAQEIAHSTLVIEGELE